MARLPVALQLYTVRDHASKDFPGTLKRVAEIGYAGVELAGIPDGLSAQDLKQQLNALNLRVAGSHTGLDQLEKDLDSIVAFNQTIGNAYIVVPYLGEERRQGAEGWRQTARAMNQVGEKLQARGMTLCYHNHSFEFQEFDGKPGLDVFFEAADARFVQSELDTYWVQHGNQDPIAYLKKYSGRVPLVHVKDMAGDEKRSFAEVGHGTMDMAGIVAAAEAAGAKWLIVEQDTCPGDPMDSARKSFEYMESQGWA